MLTLAPIILFTYNRPEHTRKTLLSLKQNHLADQSTLLIYVDGPKAGATEEQKRQVELVKQVIKEDTWCKEVIITESVENKGLALSVTTGVTDVLSKYGKAIVLEDDLVSDKWFLKYMNDSLTMYETHTDVACISGYIYPVKDALPETFFLKGADCWGWATWKRAWDILETDGVKLLKELNERNLTHDFDFNDTYPYVNMLKDQIDKKNNSWAILWYTSAYLKNKYTLYPGKSLIHNIGIDGSGTHSSTSDNFDVQIVHQEINVDAIEVKENKEAKNSIAQYFSKIYKVEKTSFINRIRNRLGI
jgi:hypothetical protein